MQGFHNLQCKLLRQLHCRLHSTVSTCGAVPQVAVVGSGPAGFYTAQQILKGHSTARVDVYEKLPVPFGLVRFGVAPDHPEVKNVISTFNKTANNKRCQFLGNVSVGLDVSVEELRKHYTAVVLAYGADDDKTFGIPGEDLPGVLSARSFVGWYNGLPSNAQLKVNLDTDSVAIFGQGNVALDVARILLTPLKLLKTTDITEYALETLSKSRVERVHLIGRRGPLQVAFTTAELREMVRLEGCQPQISPDDLKPVGPLIEEKQLPRPRRRLMELLYNTACKPAQKDLDRWSQAERQWHLMFHRSPIDFIPREDGRGVAAVRLAINTLKTSDDGTQYAVPSGDTQRLECGLVLRSIGYRCLPLVADGSVPFDAKSGIIPNTQGRVQDYPGLYCSGWVKRGPIGVIVSTMNDAFETGRNLVSDLLENRPPVLPEHVGAEAILPILKQKGVCPVSVSDWQKIDEVEKSRGAEKGKPREKIVSKSEWLELVGN